MNKFLLEENNLRTEKFEKNLEDEAFFDSLSDLLMPLEKEIRKKTVSEIPNIYILGLPRSGSTLLYQALAHGLEIAWPTNLTARLWKVPTVGMRLAKKLGLFEEPQSFDSEYASTQGAHGVHEFGYFWMRWFQYSDLFIKGKEIEEVIDWKSLQSTSLDES